MDTLIHTLATRAVATLVLSIALLPFQVFAVSEGGISMSRPSPSPTGNEVVFSGDLDGTVNLWVTSIDGLTLRKLTVNPDGDRDPAWSPDGQTIAFASRKGSTSDIWTVRPDGSGLTQITSKSFMNKQPTWSPDGKRLAFVSNRAGSSDIWVVNLDSKVTQRLTTLPGQENHPSWSPDGTQIVFSETVGESATLMVVNADGSGLRQLTTAGPAGQKDWNPSWSNYGIAFASNRGADHFQIWKIQANGTALVQVGAVIALDPTWLPNGRVIYSDEMNSGAALSLINELDPTVGTTRVVNNRQGYFAGIDIRPGNPVNPLHPGGKGAVRVAILATKTFDPVASVNRTTLTFGRTGSENSLYRCDTTTQDVNGDGLPDLICRFTVAATAVLQGDTTAILRFKSVDGISFEGRDSIKVVPYDSPEDLN
jgi:WD40-like Beta Propeller Repeat